MKSGVFYAQEKNIILGLWSVITFRSLVRNLTPFILLCAVNNTLNAKENAEESGDVIKQKFKQVQENIQSGAVKFIGDKPTFKIRPNSVLAYDIKEVTGDLTPDFEQSPNEKLATPATPMSAID
jgi:hypothetical protein